jgi:hypothetical protein
VRRRRLGTFLVVAFAIATVTAPADASAVAPPPVTVYRDRAQFIAATGATGRVLRTQLPPPLSTQTRLLVNDDLIVISHSAAIQDDVPSFVVTDPSTEARITSRNIPSPHCPRALRFGRGTTAAGVTVSSGAILPVTSLRVIGTDGDGHSVTVLIPPADANSGPSGFVGFAAPSGIDRIAMTAITEAGSRSNFVTTDVTYTPGGHRALGTAVAPPPCRS